jgi:hypothetical protein
MTRYPRLKSLGLMLVCLTFAAAPARAASVAYILGDQDTNHLQVVIEDGDSGAIEFTVTTLNGARERSGNPGGIQAFFFNGPGSEISDDNILGVPSDWKFKEGGQAGNYGSYDFVLRGNGNSRVDSLAFSIIGIEGDEPADYVSRDPFLAGFVVDLLDPDGGQETTFVGVTGVVPLPGAIWFIATAFAAAGLRARRRRAAA